MAQPRSGGGNRSRLILVIVVASALLLLQPWGPSHAVDDTPFPTVDRFTPKPTRGESAPSPTRRPAAATKTQPPAAPLQVSTGGGGSGGCPGARYSSFRCVDAGADTFVATAKEYGFPLYNRSCVYFNLTFDKTNTRFMFHAPPGFRGPLPSVTLSPRSFDLPIMGWKRRKVQRKMGPYHDWAPTIVASPVPCNAAVELPGVHTYYSPIVAPWNYAHTLLCDLFGVFWAAWDLGYRNVFDFKVIAVGKHYHAPQFKVPDPAKPNHAFTVFSRLAPAYDYTLPHGAVIHEMIAGTGTKSWSWVTGDYAAAGNRELWWAFREHIVKTTGAAERPRVAGSEGSAPWAQPVQRAPGKKLRVSLCHKKDKRGVVNYDEAIEFLRSDFPDAEFVLESAVGKPPRDQVQMFLDADVYVCNEGTLATSFFLMAPGSTFVSLPLVYHAPHLHQVTKASFRWPHASEWWREPDKMRPDPRKNTGGNIDWFPPSIPWVRVSWYDKVPLNETRIQLPLHGLRNYQPEFNIVLQRRRLAPLVRGALQHVTAAAESHHVEDSPNYSINAGLCRDLLHLTPSMVSSFNSGKCYYGMSWLCEAWTNTHYRWRFFHEKWSLSKGRCGSNRSWPPNMGLVDPREDDAERPLDEYLFYDRPRLQAAYGATDLGAFQPGPEDLRFFPDGSPGSDGVQLGKASADGGAGPTPPSDPVDHAGGSSAGGAGDDGGGDELPKDANTARLVEETDSA